MWVIKAADRIHQDGGWYTSSTTFGASHNPTSFGHLTEISEYSVAPEGAFDTHNHTDTEIFLLATDGYFGFNDTSGVEGQVFPGQVQLESAGTGIYHREFNSSKTEALHIYAIYFKPATSGLTPQYRQLNYDPEEARNALKLLVSPDCSLGSLQAQQQVWIYESKLDAGEELSLLGDDGKLGWVQLLEGKLVTGDQEVGKGDGVAYENGPMVVRATEAAYFLYILMDKPTSL